MSDQQRQHDRVSVNRDFESIEEFVAEYVTNISQGGVFIRSENPLPVGTRVNLKFSIIVEDFETIEGEGEVVRVDNDPQNTGMGVAFTKLTSDSLDLINRLMDEAGA